MEKVDKLDRKILSILSKKLLSKMLQNNAEFHVQQYISALKDSKKTELLPVADFQLIPKASAMVHVHMLASAWNAAPCTRML